MIDYLALNAPFLSKFSRPSRSPAVTRGGTLYYPIALATSVSYLQQNNFKGILLDAITRELTREETVKIIKTLNPRIIAVDTSTPSIFNDISIADEIQKGLPDSRVILVGRHVTYAPTESLNFCKEVDLLARGEYYSQILKLIRGEDYKNIDGVSYKEKKEIIHNKDAELINPEEFGFISEIYKKQLDIRRYFYASCYYPYLLLQVGWGCKFNCTFCNEVVKSNYRHRSIEHVIEELKYIKKEIPKVKEVLWDDPTFVTDEEFISQLCNAMIDNEINLAWSCATRANISLETLQIMEKSGGRVMHIGLESTTQEALNSVRKGMTFEKEVVYLENCKKVGILNHACWILGLPEDTKLTIKNTIETAKTLPAIDSIQCFPLIPTPFEDILNKESEGTIWKYLIDNNYLLTRDYSKWLNSKGLYNCVVSYPHLSNVDIEQLVEKFYKEWYFRFSFFTYKFKQSFTNWNEFQRNFITFKKALIR